MRFAGTHMKPAIMPRFYWLSHSEITHTFHTKECLVHLHLLSEKHAAIWRTWILTKLRTKRSSRIDFGTGIVIVITEDVVCVDGNIAAMKMVRAALPPGLFILNQTLELPVPQLPHFVFLTIFQQTQLGTASFWRSK